MPASALPSPDRPFAVANPHALASILEASQTRSIIASRDIFDLSGIKLWARDQPVSSALQRKLLDRQLRNPLETCLHAEDGVTPHQLVHDLERLLQEDTPLGRWLRPAGARLVKEAAQLALHPVAQLLLTASQAARPQAYDHGLKGLAIAGALMIDHGCTVPELRMAMLGGLLHDLGEIYIDPTHGEADADRTLDFTSYQQLVVHPHIGHLLLVQLTNYPASLARAVAEHHERGDGSGYPHALRLEAISPLGRLLAVTEATLAVLRDGVTPLSRASVALRVVPGEFDLGWVGAVARAQGGSQATGQPGQGSDDKAATSASASADASAPAAGSGGQATGTAAALVARLARLDSTLQAAQEAAHALVPTVQTAALREATALTQHLLGRLRAGWYASGLWSREAISGQDAEEVAAIEQELSFRLRSVERAARLRAGALTADDAGRLDRLCAVLAVPSA